MQRREWVVKNEVFVKYSEVVLRCVSWKLLRGSLPRSSVAPAIIIIIASGRATI